MAESITQEVHVGLDQFNDVMTDFARRIKRKGYVQRSENPRYCVEAVPANALPEGVAAGYQLIKIVGEERTTEGTPWYIPSAGASEPCQCSDPGVATPEQIEAVKDAIGDILDDDEEENGEENGEETGGENGGENGEENNGTQEAGAGEDEVSGDGPDLDDL